MSQHSRFALNDVSLTKSVNLIALELPLEDDRTVKNQRYARVNLKNSDYSTPGVTVGKFLNSDSRLAKGPSHGAYCVVHLEMSSH